MKFKTMPLASKYCVGAGIEIGAAAHNPFDLPNCTFVATCDGVNARYPQDLQDFEAYRHEQKMNGEETNRVDCLGDFQDLSFADGSIDYIVSSHVIEHIPNLFAAMVESDRVLKDGGTFVCLFPKRNAEPADGVRSLTTLDEMIDAWNNKVTPLSLPHLPWRTHYLVFSLHSMVRAINYLNTHSLGTWLIECVEETDSKVGNGHTVVLRKVRKLPQMRWENVNAATSTVNQLLESGAFGDALPMLKAALSYDFFDATKLYLAAVCNVKLGQPFEGLEFLRQALTLNPENEHYRRQFLAVSGGIPYRNMVL
jgi:SAM-dependent methyltransferase